MNPSSNLAISLLLVALPGCVSQHPQTAEEFRRAIPGAFMTKKESFEVSRPFREVARAFQARAPECLNVRVKTVSQSSTSYQVIVAAYKPTVVVSDTRAELHVQRHYESGVMSVTQEPPGGYYLLVADASPLGKNRTRIDIYGPSRGVDSLVGAITGWATGKSLACPDLTKG